MENQFKGKEKPWISFCMPVFNKEHRVKDAILSILTQDYQETEVIAINDGSTDNSAKKIKELEKILTPEQKKRFKFINLDKNVGACAARNIAAKESIGKYIAFLPADGYLYPGVSRFWVNALEQYPQFDFIYGGYRFVNPTEQFGQRTTDKVANVYPGKEFDAYTLETSNYIDGTFPIKRELFEKMGGWNEDIKSLQDWEYWLRAVKTYGAKGMYVPDVFFETDWPTKGGLSFDSHFNWLDRTDAIKESLDIPLRDVCVVAFAAKFHALNVAKMINADYSDNPNWKTNRYKLLYVIGAYPQFFPNIDRAMRQFEDTNAPYSNARKIIHWIGSDIMWLKELPRKHSDMAINWLNQVFDEQLCEAEHTKKELLSLGINAKVVPLPAAYMFDEILPKPKKQTIACYQPGMGMKPMYMPQLAEELAKKMPDVDFIFYGDPSVKGKKKNITYLPYVDGQKGAEELIRKSTILMRFTIHDGLPLSIAEFISAGRNVVTNVPIPAVEHIGGELKTEGIIRILRQTMKLPPNTEGAEYYRKLMDKNDFTKKINSFKNYDPIKYWNNRAISWDKFAKQYMDKFEILKVKKELTKLKPKSVIDVGCGNGQWIPYLPKAYVGIDISKNLIDIAKKKYPDNNFFVTSLETADKKIELQEKFCLAFCHTVFLHIPESKMEKAIVSLRNIAHRAIIIEPVNPETINYQHKHDFKKWFDIEKVIPMKERTMYIVKL